MNKSQDFPNNTIFKAFNTLPEGWRHTRMKSFLKLRNVKVGETWSTQQLLSLTLKGIVKKDINSNDGKIPAEFNSYQRVLPKDIVFCLFDIDETPRTVGISSYDGMITGAYSVFQCDERKVYPNYLHNYFLHVDSVKGLRPYYTGLRKVVKKDSFLGIELPLPPLQTQKQIADFLDKETTRIDTLISKKQRQIELLQEKRQAIITQAVTRGLNPDVKMKDSGVEWIGEIPEHWEVRPTFNLFEENKNRNLNNIENNLLSLSYGRIVRKDIETTFGLLPESFETYQIVEEGFIILRLTDLQNDKRSLRVGFAIENGIITSAYIGLKPKEGVNSRYFYYLLHSYDICKVYYNLGGGLRQSLRFSELKKLPLLLPPESEQCEIIEWLNGEIIKNDLLVDKIKKSINLLKEYRSSLITHAVSGQIDISEYEAST